MKTTDPYLISPELVVDMHGISFPLEYLFRHGLIVGQPGSGKSRLVLMPLIRSILQTTGNHPDKKTAMIVIDPKNELTPFLQELTKEVGRADDLVIFRPGTAWYNPLSSPFLTEAEIPEKIVLFGNHTNRNGGGGGVNEAYWANAQKSMIGALVTTCRAFYNDLTFPLLNQTFGEVNSLRDPAAMTDWLKGRSLPESALQAIKEFLKLPADTTRPCVATSVSNVLYPWKAQPLRSLISPSDTLPSIDPFTIIDQGKILVIGCASAAFGVSITPLLLALKEHTFSALLSRDQIYVQDGEAWRPLNQERPVFVIADEFQTYLCPSSTAGELAALDRLRSAKAGYLAVTQNLASIHSVLGDPSHAHRLIALFSNQWFLNNLCPYTSQQAGWLMGTKIKQVVQYAQEPRMAPPLMTGHRSTGTQKGQRKSGVVIPQVVPRVDAAVLAALKTGEYWLRLANGTIHKRAVAQIPTTNRK